MLWEVLMIHKLASNNIYLKIYKIYTHAVKTITLQFIYEHYSSYTHYMFLAFKCSICGQQMWFKS